ncbi:MAG: sulfate transporter [Planctomycetes bacterium]|nr:sulfate transporter [Planctomycetota bacterium]
MARDLNAGVVVFLVALPLCLGVALASGAPLISGIIAGIVGGLVVGAISGSNTSVSGPAAGLTAIVAAQLDKLESFQQFLLVVVLAGILQVVLGALRAGTLSAFFPSAVIKGLLAAIGVILILKQIPHILGHDNDPEGEMSFEQPDHENTFSEIGKLFAGEIHQGALVIGLLSLLVLVAWDSFKFLKKTPIPVPLLVVVGGVLISQWLSKLGGEWVIGSSHLVEVPVANQLQDLAGFFQTPDWSGLTLSAVYFSAITTALVASLETLLNLEAIDKIDPQQRLSPPNRELVAQGIGNITCGLIGGIPVTSVIVRSSVNINAGARTKLSTLIHGGLLALSVAFLPTYLNLIPLSCLAAILLATGFKLISPSLIMKMYREGYKQFVPFLVTTIAIVLTDLIAGVGIGLAVSIAFILQSNIRTPISQVSEKYFDNDVTHIQLANQVSFLNRVALENALTQAKPGQHLLLDARNTDYIDPDILSLLRDYIDKTAPIRQVLVSTKGFKKEFNIPERILFGEYTTKELQEKLSPTEVLAALIEGNKRFLSGQRLMRDLGRQISGTASYQYPLAVVLSCIDSRSPAEIIFDVGLGDIFTIRIAGNVVRSKVLGSLEYACAVAGARLVLVMGHTRCGAVSTAVDLAYSKQDVCEVTGCQHLELIVNEIQTSVFAQDRDRYLRQDTEGKRRIVDEVARRNVIHAVKLLPEQSLTLSDLVAQKRIAIVGAFYDVVSGEIDFLMDEAIGLEV